MAHEFTLRVYYEDTDLAGLVYYANYLKFIERARSEYVRELGIDQAAMKDGGLVFAVSRVEADYIQPAKYDDLLVVRTTITRKTAARLTLTQQVLRNDTRLFEAVVTIVCLDETGRPQRLPAGFRA
ncbi:tol-pal system-associated acyl-CoA thioesterase [Thalassobius sp. I31.1]|uniref:tol-pal system-associated acyl-CoA thioesterase n=1 Tax=Thalassobius sp. I31.1 TaxID=2109912 RepID=UPI000D1995D8|nr:tol-pal system-associated acyl-CoA thioesterase [Thalassobius sp. I31.1]